MDWCSVFNMFSRMHISSVYIFKCKFQMFQSYLVLNGVLNWLKHDCHVNHNNKAMKSCHKIDNIVTFLHTVWHYFSNKMFTYFSSSLFAMIKIRYYGFGTFNNEKWLMKTQICVENWKSLGITAAILDLCKLGNVPQLGFPRTFDMLYWGCFWNNW